jgi:hypothetical protein
MCTHAYFVHEYVYSELCICMYVCMYVCMLCMLCMYVCMYACTQQVAPLLTGVKRGGLAGA